MQMVSDASLATAMSHQLLWAAWHLSLIIAGTLAIGAAVALLFKTPVGRP